MKPRPFLPGPSGEFGAVGDPSGPGVLLREELQELGVSRRLRQPQRRVSVLVGEADGQQAAGLTEQQLGQPTHPPAHGKVEGRLPETTALWRRGADDEMTLKTRQHRWWQEDRSETETRDKG